MTITTGYTPLTAIFSGRAAGTTEPRHVGCEHGAPDSAGTTTSAHHVDHGGLRGHSIDAATYPFRVIYQGGWAVEDAAGQLVARYSTSSNGCRKAHASARRLKADYPAGRINA